MTNSTTSLFQMNITTEEKTKAQELLKDKYGKPGLYGKEKKVRSLNFEDHVWIRPEFGNNPSMFSAGGLLGFRHLAQAHDEIIAQLPKHSFPDLRLSGPDP